MDHMTVKPEQDLNAPDAGRLRPVRLTYDDAEAGV